jgi:hypothetical protein
MSNSKFKKHILAHREQCGIGRDQLIKMASLKKLSQREIKIMKIANDRITDQMNLIDDMIIVLDLNSKSMKNAANKRAKTVHKNIRSKSKRK